MTIVWLIAIKFLNRLTALIYIYIYIYIGLHMLLIIHLKKKIYVIITKIAWCNEGGSSAAQQCELKGNWLYVCMQITLTSDV